MITMTKQEMDQLCSDGVAIDCKGGYPAVVLHGDGKVTKIWARKKGLLSSSTLRPYSTRFVKNAARLESLGILVPKVLRHAKLENSHVRLVTYQGIAGKSIRELLETSPTKVNIQDLCSYIHKLHDKGIMFGGMHLGNIIHSAGNYGLIDFTDVTFYRHPLTAKQRATNLKVPLRYQQDVERIKTANLPDLTEVYLNTGTLSLKDKQTIANILA